ESVQEMASRCLLAFAEEAEHNLKGPSQETWLDKLEWERDNLRAAIENSKNHEHALRMAAALRRYWRVRGHLSEGRTLIERALGSSSELPEQLRAQALKGAGNLAWALGDLSAAERYHNQSLDLYENLEDTAGIAGELNNLGNLARGRG